MATLTWMMKCDNCGSFAADPAGSMSCQACPHCPMIGRIPTGYGRNPVPLGPDLAGLDAPAAWEKAYASAAECEARESLPHVAEDTLIGVALNYRFQLYRGLHARGPLTIAQAGIPPTERKNWSCPSGASVKWWTTKDGFVVCRRTSGPGPCPWDLRVWAASGQ